MASPGPVQWQHLQEVLELRPEEDVSPVYLLVSGECVSAIASVVVVE